MIDFLSTIFIYVYSAKYSSKYSSFFTVMSDRPVLFFILAFFFVCVMLVSPFEEQFYDGRCDIVVVECR